tara:strand:- start:167 stop:691 length:525 start_codon:yes stop_codon:yes gene_type:complete
MPSVPLHRIGYYGLSAFAYPYRDLCPIPTPEGEAEKKVRCDKFKKGTTFDHAIDFYLFDKALCIELLDAIERIEIAVRTAMIEVLGERGPYAHRDRRSYNFRAVDHLRQPRMGDSRGVTHYAQVPTKVSKSDGVRSSSKSKSTGISGDALLTIRSTADLDIPLSPNLTIRSISD